MNYTNPGTGQKRSWIYTDTLVSGDASNYLLYYQYYNTLSCEIDSTGSNYAQDQIGSHFHPLPSLLSLNPLPSPALTLLPSMTGPFDECEEYVQGDIIRRQIKSKVVDIAGIVTPSTAPSSTPTVRPTGPSMSPTTFKPSSSFPSVSPSAVFVISTIAGIGYYDGDGGAATSAIINYPSGVAVDASGGSFVYSLLYILSHQCFF